MLMFGLHSYLHLDRSQAMTLLCVSRARQLHHSALKAFEARYTSLSYVSPPFPRPVIQVDTYSQAERPLRMQLRHYDAGVSPLRLLTLAVTRQYEAFRAASAGDDRLKVSRRSCFHPFPVAPPK
jgi:hypothetical protein